MSKDVDRYMYIVYIQEYDEKALCLTKKRVNF